MQVGVWPVALGGEGDTWAHRFVRWDTPRTAVHFIPETTRERRNAIMQTRHAHCPGSLVRRGSLKEGEEERAG